MLNILFFSHSSEIRGAEKSLELLVRNLDRSRFNPIVVMAGRGPLYNIMESQSVKVYGLTYYWWIPGTDRGLDYYILHYQTLPGVVHNLRKIIKEHKISLVHTNSIVVCGGALAACLEKIPHVWHIREMMRTQGSGLSTPYGLDNTLSLVGALSNRVVAVSRAVKKDLIPAISENKIEVVYNGVEYKKSLTRIKEGLPVKIVYVGNIIERKGPDLFVEAGMNLLKDNCNVEFYIIGECSDKALTDKIKEKIKKGGYTNKFNFLGFRKDVLDLLCEMDIYVLSSRNDPFPRTVIEGMAAGCAIIVSDCGGATEAVRLSGAGEVVAIDAVELFNAMKRIVENPILRKRYSDAGIKAAEELFSSEAYVKSMENLFGEIINEPVASSNLQQMFGNYFHRPNKPWWKIF